MIPSKRIALYSGTFDPITLGHLDVVRRAAGLFDQLIIAVAVAHHKKTLFPLEARVLMAQVATKNIAKRARSITARLSTDSRFTRAGGC